MQHIAILSVNHQLAPVAIREKVAFTSSELTPALKTLKNISEIDACVILSTCNRSEVYVVSNSENTQEILSSYLANIHHIEKKIVDACLSYYQNEEAIRHIFHVATGLDSLVLGEPQILGQLKEAYHIAKDAKVLNKLLEKLFQHAFYTAKKVRTDTQIGTSPVSVAYCAIKLSGRIFSNLSEQSVLLIGAGEMIELCARHLKQAGVSNIIVANRTIENAQKIARSYNAHSISFKQLTSVAHKADIIISSTAASVPIIGKGLIETALKQRRHKPMFILDIAIPRDIEPEVGQLEDVFLYTVDDLQQVVDVNIHFRQQEKALAEEIISEQSLQFTTWLKSLPNEQVIQSYQTNAYLMKEKIVTNALKKLQNGNNAETVVQELADQLTNKLLHAPFKNIKQAPKQSLDQCGQCIPKNLDNDITLQNS